MGQGDIINLLKTNPNYWFTYREIKNEINISLGATTVSLKRLREKGEVDYKISKRGTRDQYYYKFKK